MTKPWFGVALLAVVGVVWYAVRDDRTPADVTPPSYSRSSSIQALPALAEREPSEPIAEAPRADDSAFLAVKATLERDLADGRWSVDDRDRLNAGVRGLPKAQSTQLYEVLFPKLNDGSVTSDIDGPPL